MGSGGLFFDYDEDGWVDVFLVDGGSLVDAKVDATARDRLYRNRGNGTFEDVSASSGITHAGYGMGACAADYDNDGWTDLYVTGVGPNRLYHNDGGKRFSDVTSEGGSGGSPVFSTSCAFVDIDRDNDVDLFVVNYVDARIDNNALLRRHHQEDPHLLSSAQFRAARERALPQQRQRHVHRRQP